MFQELRDYWLPMMLFVAALLTAAMLLLLVALMPFVVDHVAVNFVLLNLFAGDVVVRRTSIAGAVGLIVTAFVFFRPRAARNDDVAPRSPKASG